MNLMMKGEWEREDVGAGPLRRGGRGFALACLLAGLLLLGPEPAGAQYLGGSEPGTGGDGLPTEADCRVCHEDLGRFPMLETNNVNKHHLLVGSAAVLPTAPPGSEGGDSYDCLFCHPPLTDPETGFYTVTLYRDCLACHPVETVSGRSQMKSSNRHHELGYNCIVCHERRR